MRKSKQHYRISKSVYDGITNFIDTTGAVVELLETLDFRAERREFESDLGQPATGKLFLLTHYGVVTFHKSLKVMTTKGEKGKAPPFICCAKIQFAVTPILPLRALGYE